MSRDLLFAIGGGLMSAIAAVAFFGGSVFSLMFVYFASVPLLMVGLGLGPRAVAIAAGAGICATGIVGGILPAGLFGLIQALPAWIITCSTITKSPETIFIAPEAKENNENNQLSDAKEHIGLVKPGLALSVLALLAGLIILVTAACTGVDGMKMMIEGYLTEAFKSMISAMGTEARQIMVIRLTAFFPGAIGASWITMVALNAVVAQGILIRAGKNLRLTPLYANINLPLWYSWPMVGIATLALVGNSLGNGELGYAAYNTAMVIAVPYFFLGLAVVHTLARQLATPGLILIGVYGVIIVSLWAAVVVVGVGIAEQWVGIRGRNEDG
jgi:hypothetical protein